MHFACCSNLYMQLNTLQVIIVVQCVNASMRLWLGLCLNGGPDPATPAAQKVFSYNGEPVAQVTIAAWYKALKRCGIDDFRWHD